MPKNSLKIKASTLKLEFAGEDREIREGYEMTRELIISCFQEQLLAVEAHARALEEDSESIEERHQQAQAAHARQSTQSMHRVSPPKPSPASPASPAKIYQPPKPEQLSHVSVALASDLYNKVCVLERQEFESSIFHDALRFEEIARVYLRHEQKERFDRFFTLGKVLWRELTSQGRDAVRHEP